MTDETTGLIITLVIVIFAAMFCIFFILRKKFRRHPDITSQPLVEKIVELDPERDIKSQIVKVYFRADPDTRATFSDVLKIIKEELTEEELKRYAEIKERYHSH